MGFSNQEALVRNLFRKKGMKKLGVFPRLKPVWIALLYLLTLITPSSIVLASNPEAGEPVSTLNTNLLSSLISAAAVICIVIWIVLIRHKHPPKGSK